MTERCSIPMCVVLRSAAVTLIITATSLAGYPAKNVVLRSHLPLSNFSASFAEDSWGYVSDSGREYAIIGLSNGTGFVEITDPDNPVIVAVMTQSNRGRDMKVYQNYVYSSSDSGPTHVYDVSNIDSGVITHVRSWSQGTHNLAVDEVSGFLYLAVGGPMRVYDLSDPSDPTLVGTWPGQTHDAHVVTYEDGPYAGRQIAFVFAGWDGELNIVDVTDKSNMFLLGQTSYPNPGYTHQGWLTADRQYLYVSDEVDSIPRTTIINVGNLSNPTFVTDFTTGLDSTDHNLYVHEGYLFEANYTSGLRIFNVTHALIPVEVGYFDTYPANNAEGYSGAWNVYPFFPSGTVIVSDRSSGLFVLDVSQATGGGCEADADGDGVCDEDDICPGGDDNIDTDSDGVPDFCDPCPLDNPDDTDGDGVCDSDDPCPLDNPDDTDGDGVCDSDDICPGGNDNVDTDGDGVPDFCDPCPLDNPDDTDGDGVCDSDDPCPLDNPDDTDGDGVCDSDDICEGDDATGDGDGDGVCDSSDNCPDHANPDQADCDNDGVGDVCAIADGLSEDCNENEIPDECDIADEESSDNNKNGIPDECECPADFDGSGDVGASDLAILLGAWGPNPGHPADFDGDGFVNAADLAQLLGAWGPCV